MRESEIKSNVAKHFEDEGYQVIKEFELDCIDKRLKIDLVAFKWQGNYNLETIAIECKGEDVGIPSIVDSIYSQVREYQRGFPTVYLALPKKKKKLPQTLLEAYGVGLLTISDEVEEKISPQEDRVAPKLDSDIHGYGVRQKLVACSIFSELLGGDMQKLRMVHDKNFGFGCWTDEFCNYYLGNTYSLTRDYYLSITLQKQENVGVLKKVDVQDLYNLIENLPEDFKLSLWRVFVGGRNMLSYMLIDKYFN